MNIKHQFKRHWPDFQNTFKHFPNASKYSNTFLCNRNWLTPRISEEFAQQIRDVNCRNCLRCLAKQLGLSLNTPPEIIFDKFEETNYEKTLVESR